MSQSEGGGQPPMWPWWQRRSMVSKVLLILGALIVVLSVAGAFMENEQPASGSAAIEESSSAATEGSSSAEDGTTTEANASPSTPKERVQEAIGDEVQAAGYAGTLEVKDVSFEGTEVQVTVTTPGGGFEGASCADLDDGAQAVFETIYNDAGWNGGAVTVFQGGLVDSSTGQELPDANTGIYTMPAGQATQIDWTDENALLNINWALYRDFCHPALKQD